MTNFQEDLFIKVKNYAIVNSEQGDIHGYQHVQRVYDLCINISKELKVDLKILKTAALLHDIGRIKEKTDQFKVNHSNISAELAKTFLNSLSSYYSNEETEQIIHCIRSHSYSSIIKPNSLEAKILSDADKLDALGAIGLYRTIGFTVMNEGGLKEIIMHLEDKILNLPKLLYFDISKRIAERRKKIINEFYEEILNESKLRNLL
jgi:uncharacterized protein